MARLIIIPLLLLLTATLDVGFGRICDEINEISYCSQELVCVSCPSFLTASADDDDDEAAGNKNQVPKFCLKRKNKFYHYYQLLISWLIILVIIVEMLVYLY